HIGNARPAILNDEYCKKYKGKLILFIDDTIGSDEKGIVKDAYKLIPEGLKWLGVKFDKKVYYKSDRLNIYYRHAEEIIKKGAAYVCSCEPEKLKDNRKNGVECGCRKQNIEITFGAWKNMFDAPEGSAALRIKTDMKHPNPAFRDRVLFRISDREHPRVGKKYRIWPLLEFSWAVDDCLLGITHVIRGKELMIESEMEKFIWNIFGWKGPELLHSGLLQIEGIKLSKSKSKEEVLSGKYTGWDDPRTFSLQSFARRGFEPEAVRNFLLQFGMNQTEVTVSAGSFYSENKKIIDAEANRYFFVSNMKKIKIGSVPDIKKSEAPLHPDFPKRGKRGFRITNEFFVDDEIRSGQVYRFMHLFNFKDNKFISEKLDQSLNAKLIHWLPADDNLVKVEVMMEDGSLVHGFGEPALKKVKVDDLVQFERKFFARLDKKDGNKLVFWYTHR
ncbi:MAG: glutamate--tRNA ligase, partial [Nanoarchaeota archaeon]